jgi:hypothetical protein
MVVIRPVRVRILEAKGVPETGRREPMRAVGSSTDARRASYRMWA